MTNEKVQWLILGLVVIGFIGFGGFMMKQDAQLDRVSNAVVALSSNIQALSQRQTASAPSAQPSSGSAPAVQPPSSQVTGQIRATCGDFPRSSGDGGPTSRYSVCLNVQNQTCYLKKDYQKQITGCNPRFNDENPYGDDNCFESLIDAYDTTGKRMVAGVKEYRTADSCEPTTQQYFDAKVR